MKKSEEIVDYFFDNLGGYDKSVFSKLIRVLPITENAGTSIYKCLRPYGMIMQIRLADKVCTSYEVNNFRSFDLKAVMEKCQITTCY